MGESGGGGCRALIGATAAGGGAFLGMTGVV